MATLQETVDTYGAAWRETDPAKRLELLETVWADDAVYVDPMARVEGRAALVAHIGEVLASTGGRVEITSRPNAHHDVAHFTWHMVGPDGAILVRGHDMATLDTDGRIARLAGFFGDPDPLA
ncbi:SnoaL-like domain-containing protein [Cribrihabitans marinus]|uniref:SnoaL-like domain-containing protein n=1 Tax=Cribrihabitans marinus TaxID=1227549 RepID=A0A1H6VTR6_9RHOB|nr:nuclear transport factor 2 family protein [Cribrihabitans marinus]GGH25571.1 isomerase [Cribrihabitans marinus]SEJ05237.1 SnoaL-like domain-containing protein [Cribrihabitans marinus]